MKAVRVDGDAGHAAKADPSVKAKEAFREAKALFKERRYAAAVAESEQAYALNASPVVFFNIGRCHEQLEDVGKALRAYREYLRQRGGQPSITSSEGAQGERQR